MINQTQRQKTQAIKRVVVKIGSSLLTNNGKGLHKPAFVAWATQLAKLQAQGIEVILVSSGAIAEGVVRMGLAERPKTLPGLQACAAIGQMGLIQLWSQMLDVYDIKTAQVLLTHEDLSHRDRYLNTGQALNQMLEWGVIPVINENDNIATDEIRFGDNDTLGAMSASLVQADLYIILTDQKGVFDDNPSKNPAAKLIECANAMDDNLFSVAGEGGKLGSGGMLTKIKAARLAAMSGCNTVIVHGSEENVISRIVAGENIGTLLTSDNERVTARKQWLAAHLQTAGTLVLDDGAVQAICTQNKSLLPIGVTAVQGEFKAGDVVECINQTGERVALGRVSYDSVQAQKIHKTPTAQIADILGVEAHHEMIHKDYLVIS